MVFFFKNDLWRENKLNLFIQDEDINEVFLRIVSISNSTKKETNFWAINNIRTCDMNGKIKSGNINCYLPSR